MKRDAFWGYEIPESIPGLDLHRFDPARYYSDTEIAMLNEELKAERLAWLQDFGDLDPVIVKALG